MTLRLIKRQSSLPSTLGSFIQLVAPVTGSRPVPANGANIMAAAARRRHQWAGATACALTQCIGVSTGCSQQTTHHRHPRQSHSHGLACQLRHQQGWDFCELSANGSSLQRPQAWRQGQHPRPEHSSVCAVPDGSHGLACSRFAETWLVEPNG